MAIIESRVLHSRPSLDVPGCTLRVTAMLKSKSALLAFDVVEGLPDDDDDSNSTTTSRILRREALLDVHDVHKLARLRDDGCIPALSRPGTIEALLGLGLLEKSVDQVSGRLMHASLTDRRDLPNLTPTLPGMFLFANAFAAMHRMQYGTPHPNEVLVDPKFFPRYGYVLREASDEAKRLVETRLDENLLTAFVRMGVLTTKHYPSIQLQETLAQDRMMNVVLTREGSLNDDLRFQVAQLEYIKGLYSTRSPEFWVRHRETLLDLPTYHHGAEGEHISEFDDELYGELESFSEAGLIHLKDREFVYKAGLLDGIYVLMDMS